MVPVSTLAAIPGAAGRSLPARVAESLLDRLINTSHQVFMNGPSYRPNKRPGRVIPTQTTSGN
jgi:DNA replication protein DnaC